MAIQVQIRRGTNKENNAFTGAQGEVTVNTINNSLRIHDGETVGGHIVLSESQITNCITEIPQDIKLELNNGILTLKAGSKVYVPNGNTFDIHNMTYDISHSSTSAVSDGSVFVFWTNVGLQLRNISQVSSGPTEPTITVFSGWYDTTNNLVKLDASGVAWQTATVSFPIAVITVSSGAITSIDQVFNGLGYIGSTVFTLPGVKGLYPDGRNADGTLKNGLVNCTSVQISSVFNDTAQHCLFLQSNGRCQWYTRAGFYYDKETNTIHNSLNDIKLNAIDAGVFDTTSGVISNFNPKTVFHAVDYNDVVRTNSDQTIDGTKTFTTNIVVKRNSGQRLIVCKDANNVDIGSLEAVDNSNDNHTELFAFDENGSNSAQIGIHYNNGSPYGFAPTPASVYDNSTKIATTAHIIAVLDKIYPVGALYIGTQSTCPIAALIPNSTWALVATDRALWGGDGTNANTTIAAGLPNITGSVNVNGVYSGASGAFYSTSQGRTAHGWDGNGTDQSTYTLDASRSSSIYGSSSTVQPPAYVVNVWRRTT